MAPQSYDRSGWLTLACVLGVIFVAEAGVMLLLSIFAPEVEGLALAILDSVLLTALAGPPILVLIVNPVRVAARKLASARDEANRHTSEAEEACSQVESHAIELTAQATQLAEARDLAVEATKAKSQFLASMSHEIRTPMNGVIGMTELLLNSSLNSDQREFAETVKRSADTLLNLINEILDLSKIEAGKVTITPIPFDLSRSISEVSGLLGNQAAQKRLDLRVHYAPDAPRSLVGDPDRIRQVILNLAGNAIKFTDQGHVSITVECEERGDAEVRMKISVEDTGIGMTPDAIEKIFDGFTQADDSTTRRFGGTGLGLTISKRLIEMMGGAIGVRSRVGEGSAFWVSLPLPLSDAASVISASSAELTSGLLPAQFDARVLVVDDNPVNRTVAERMLENLGCQVDLATDGSEALEAIARTRYDIVFMDHLMPVMDGLAATEEIRRRENDTTGVPIVALTASAMMGDRAKCLVAGMNDYLDKPVKQMEFRQMLARWTSTGIRIEGSDSSELGCVTLKPQRKSGSREAGSQKKASSPCASELQPHREPEPANGVSHADRRTKPLCGPPWPL